MIHKLCLIPGSFNPLHEAHIYIYNEVTRLGWRAAFEISINHISKNVTLKDAEQRVKSIRDSGFIAVITDKKLIVDKLNLLRHAKIADKYAVAIGSDNYPRLLETHRPSTIMDKCFVVVRDGNIPANLDSNCELIIPPTKIWSLSSTDIRNSKI